MVDKSDLLAPAPAKGPAWDKLDVEYAHAMVRALEDAMAVKGVAIPNEGDQWVDGKTALVAFFPEWRKVECERLAAQARAKELIVRLRDMGVVEVTQAEGRSYYRLKP